MTFYLVFCPSCGCCYPYVDNATALPCGHRKAGTVRVIRETVNSHECIWLKIRNGAQADFWLRPDGAVEYKPKGKEIRVLKSLDAYLEQRNPKLLAAFEARRDVRRGAGA